MGMQNGKSLQGLELMKINHPMFQNARILEEQSQFYMIISMHIEEHDYNRWKSVLANRKSPNTYLLLPSNSRFDNKSFCGSTGTVNIMYELLPFILAEEIQKQRKRKSKFQQTQLWILLYSLAAASSQMRKNFDSKIGDVRPQNIFLNQNGDIKISCLNSWPREKSNFQKAYEHQDTFLAPEEMENLHIGGKDDFQNYPAEIFSIGITILSTALLNDFNDIYDVKNMKFDYKKAQQYLHEWKNNKIYSQILTAVVCNLCSFSPEKRVTSRQFWLWIKDYERDIKSKKKFFIRKVPLKIQSQLQLMRDSMKQIRNEQVLRNRVFNQVKPFCRNFIVRQQKIGFQRINLPLNIVRYVSPVHGNGQESIGLISVSQSLPYSSFKESQLAFRNILSESVCNEDIGPKLQSKFDETQAEKISQGVKSPFNKQSKSKQVQVSFSPPESTVSENRLQASKEGHFLYTRRIVNPTTNSLLGEESINSEQYHEGIIEKNQQNLHEKKSLNILKSN